MFFGFSYGEVIVTVAVLAVVIGPKELPIIARVAGRMTGQAAAFLSRSRSQWQKFAEENEIAQLHKEMQESLGQLRAIQNELRYGSQLMNPGPLAQRAMGVPPMRAVGQAAAPNQATPAHAQPPKSTRRGAAADALTDELLAERLASIDPQLLQALQLHLSGQAPTHGRTPLHRPSSRTAEDADHERQWSSGLSSAEGSTGRDTMGASSAAMQSSGGDTREGSRAASRQARSAGAAEGGGALPAVRGEDDRGLDGFVPGTEAVGGNAARALPLSAVAMGLAPERSGEGTLCGSDIAEDALAEEEVAHMAQRFFQQQQPPPKS
ncbi:probable Sec-independent protein translocase protein TatB at N-terminal half [Coccomyxa sp. Obi]|nr:probable Sec-independent protein translocase protein TatB at N-terminal half [Coccomyxa sp. Obi]